MRGVNIYATEKIDGQSALYFIKDGKFGVCSRNVMPMDGRKGGYDEGQYFEMAKKYDLERKLRGLGKNIGVQVEIAGPGIQGSKLRLKERQIFAYQIQDLDYKRFIDYRDFKEICEMLDIPTVPEIELPKGASENYTVDDWTAVSVRKSVVNPDVWAEGIVVRSAFERNFSGLKTVQGRCSFKVINPEFINAYD